MVRQALRIAMAEPRGQLTGRGDPLGESCGCEQGRVDRRAGRERRRDAHDHHTDRTCDLPTGDRQGDFLVCHDHVGTDQHRRTEGDEDVDDDDDDDRRHHSPRQGLVRVLDVLVVVGQQLEALVRHEHGRPGDQSDPWTRRRDSRREHVRSPPTDAGEGQAHQRNELEPHEEDLDSSGLGSAPEVHDHEHGDDGDRRDAWEPRTEADHVADVLAEREGVDRVREDVADDEDPRQAAGESVLVDLAEEGECPAALTEARGELDVCVSGTEGDEPSGHEAQPRPRPGDADDHAEGGEDATPDHAADGHRPRSLE